jgi:hypothetical protein
MATPEHTGVSRRTKNQATDPIRSSRVLTEPDQAE